MHFRFSLRPCLSAIVVPPLLLRFGTRRTALAVAVVAVVSCVLSSFAVNVYWLHVTYGLCLGTLNAQRVASTDHVVSWHFPVHTCPTHSVTLGADLIGSVKGAVCTEQHVSNLTHNLRTNTELVRTRPFAFRMNFFLFTLLLSPCFRPSRGP